MADKKDYLYCLIIGIIAAIIAYFFNFTWGNGLLLGLVTGLLHYLIMAYCLGKLLQKQRFSPILFVLYFAGNMGLMALALAISCFYPTIFNVIACAIGLIMHNLYIYLQALISRQK